ncbi:hypothetical protein [Massilia sp. Root335]|uniref:hypothetical protein n=1 Tax=Massilia sp. Root335 TaxID=1736517 RepID=UPI0012F6E25E|nr:hypothetical protein [Massilia sp. Root335]
MRKQGARTAHRGVIFRLFSLLPLAVEIDVVSDAIRAPAAPAPPPTVETVASAAVKTPATAPKPFDECAEASDRHMVAELYRLSRDFALSDFGSDSDMQGMVERAFASRSRGKSLTTSRKSRIPFRPQGRRRPRNEIPFFGDLDVSPPCCSAQYTHQLVIFR